jgi:hypothetical protein
MPGGYESLDLSLPRDPAIDYQDLEGFSTIRVKDAAGTTVGEYRLERSPRTAGDKFAISPSAVGWQAHLDDNKAFMPPVFVDRDRGRWQSPQLERLLQLADAGFSNVSSIELLDQLTWVLPEEVPISAITEAWWAGQASAGAAFMQYVGTQTGDWTGLEASAVYGVDAPHLTASESVVMTLDGTKHQATLAATWRYLLLRAFNTSGTALTPASVTTPPPNVRPRRTIEHLAVYGPHGLRLHATRDNEPDGLLASDIVAYVIPLGAPLLRLAPDSIDPSTFAIPHSAMQGPTTVSEVVRDATKYGLQDWAVWNDRTFYWHPRGARGRAWRARVAPAQLEETGPQVDRLWESIVVSYQDPGDNVTRTVGPPGSGADLETPLLKDTDPDNPANQLGDPRRDLLQAGVATPDSAIELGRRFLQEQKQLDSSGRARIVGHVEDDHGVIHPYTHVHAGDTIAFVDASDPSPRRIVRADHDKASKTCSIDLDAPPEGLAALLERFGAALAPIGL